MVSLLVALVIQHGSRMRHVVVHGQPRSAILFTLGFIEGTDYEKKVIGHKMCVLISSTTFV
jgi:hypothetical protein